MSRMAGRSLTGLPRHERFGHVGPQVTRVPPSRYFSQMKLLPLLGRQTTTRGYLDIVDHAPKNNSTTLPSCLWSR